MMVKLHTSLHVDMMKSSYELAFQIFSVNNEKLNIYL